MFRAKDIGGQTKKTKQFQLLGHLQENLLPESVIHWLLTVAERTISYYTPVIYENKAFQVEEDFPAIYSLKNQWPWEKKSTIAVITGINGEKNGWLKGTSTITGFFYAGQSYVRPGKGWSMALSSILSHAKNVRPPIM